MVTISELRLLSLLAALLTPVSAIAVEHPAQTGQPDWQRYFPCGYAQSRDAFRDDCKKLNGVCGSIPVDSRTDSDLTIDTAFFSLGNGTRLLVVQSGIHGSEAAAGAAVQRLIINRYVPAMLAQGIDVYLIHALNPWGFAHGRRTDEWNVNLNRNFSLSDDIYKIKNPYYLKYRKVFEPAEPANGDLISQMTIGMGFIGGYIGSGFDSKPINIGFNSGQYEFKDGLNYGGTHAAQQTDLLRKMLVPLFDDRKYRKILFLDYHTGLGEAGVLSVIKGKSSPPALLLDFERAIGLDEAGADTGPRTIAGHPHIVVKSGEDEGNFPTEGDVIDFVPLLAHERGQDSVLAVTMEYGTKGSDMIAQIASATTMILENQEFQHNCVSTTSCTGIGPDFQSLFNPTDMSWRSAVTSEAAQVFSGIAARW